MGSLGSHCSLGPPLLQTSKGELASDGRGDEGSSRGQTESPWHFRRNFLVFGGYRSLQKPGKLRSCPQSAAWPAWEDRDPVLITVEHFSRRCILRCYSVEL